MTMQNTVELKQMKGLDLPLILLLVFVQLANFPQIIITYAGPHRSSKEPLWSAGIYMSDALLCHPNQCCQTSDGIM